MIRRRLTALFALVALLVGISAVNLSNGPVHIGGAAPAAAYPLGDGYLLAATDGGIFNFGASQFFGSTGSLNLKAPIVGAAGFPFLEGYWLVASDGGVFSFGSSQFYGSLGATKLNAPIVGMASTPTGQGYYLVASDGGVFTFGDAAFQGSTGGIKLNKPIVGMAVTPSGKGYWMVATDGGIFAFGDAGFFGSEGALKLNKPVVGMSATRSGQGYYLVASDGGIFTHGDAVFRGSRGGEKLNAPIVGMDLSPSGNGYQFVATDGGIFNYGDSQFFGSTGGIKLNKPVLGMAVRPRLGINVDAFAPSSSQSSNWVQVGDDWRLRLTYTGASAGPDPAGARIYGPEGLDVSQLGTLSYVLESGACTNELRFALFYRTAAGANGQLLMPCVPGNGANQSFNPVSMGAPGNAIVQSLDIWNGPLTNGTVDLDDFVVAGVSSGDYLTHRL